MIELCWFTLVSYSHVASVVLILWGVGCELDVNLGTQSIHSFIHSFIRETSAG